jgi:hypothetical protein
MLCPECEGQGSIYQAKVVDLGIELCICDECEACWTKEEYIGTRNFQDLPTFLEEHGISYEGSTIEKIGNLDRDYH